MSVPVKRCAPEAAKHQIFSGGEEIRASQAQLPPLSVEKNIPPLLVPAMRFAPDMVRT